jgi:hypothetical protein
MAKYAICPICEARIYSKNPKITLREEVELHLHDAEARTWIQSRQIARSSKIIMEDDMSTKSKEAQNDTRNQDVLSCIADKVSKLENLPEMVKNLDNRISSFEDQIKTDFEGQRSSQSPEGSSNEARMDAAELELRDTRISDLESQLAILQSPEHRENLILEWLNSLDRDSYYSLGVRKGFLEEMNPETQTSPGELHDPSPEVVFSREKPEDLTGWAYSKTLNCYVKLEGGMNE